MKKPRKRNFLLSQNLIVGVVGCSAILILVFAFVFIKRHDYREVTHHNILTGSLSRWASWSVEVEPNSQQFQLAALIPSMFASQRIQIYQTGIGMVVDSGWQHHEELAVYSRENGRSLEAFELLTEVPKSRTGTLHHRIVYHVTPIRYWNGLKGHVIAYSDKEQLFLKSRKMKTRLYGFAGAAFLLLILTIAAFDLLYTKPLKQLIFCVETGNLSTKIFRRINRRPDELGFLASAFERERNRRNDFTADILHELKNPLSISRLGLVELISAAESQAEKENLERLLIENVRMEKLLVSIRELGAYENNRSAEVCDVRTVLENLMILYTDAPIKLLLSGKLDVDLFIHMNPDDFGRVCRNLIDNAIDFSPVGSEIELKVSHENSNTVQVSVCDHGVGISEGERHKIFDRFYSNRNQQQSPNSHHGLGLSIAKTIVESAGGTIVCESQVEEGTIIKFKIPLVIRNC